MSNIFTVFVWCLALTAVLFVLAFEWAKRYVKRAKIAAKANRLRYIKALKKSEEFIIAWELDEDPDKVEKHPDMVLVIVLMKQKVNNLKESIQLCERIIDR